MSTTDVQPCTYRVDTTQASASMAQALPRGDSSLQSIFALDNASLDAYDVCTELEDKASDEEELRNARLLGYLILYAPSSAARYEIGKTIHSCSSDGEKEDLRELSTRYMDFFVCHQCLCLFFRVSF